MTSVEGLSICYSIQDGRAERTPWCGKWTSCRPRNTSHNWVGLVTDIPPNPRVIGPRPTPLAPPAKSGLSPPPTSRPVILNIRAKLVQILEQP